jgi:hypothetical protein
VLRYYATEYKAKESGVKVFDFKAALNLWKDSPKIFWKASLEDLKL